MQFQFRHVNRAKYPQRHVLVCEDDLDQLASLAKHFAKVFEPQGVVQFSFVSGGLHAASIMNYAKVDLVILDHDMPEGNGSDLLDWMKKYAASIPVITASGIPQNNDALMKLGAAHKFTKAEVIRGKADSVIRQLLGL